MLDMPLSERLPQEVAFARLKRVKADLSARPHARSGRRRVGPAEHVHIEEGWTPSDTVNLIKREILRQVAPDRRVPTVFDRDDDDYLDERLAARNDRDDPPFLAIDLDNEQSAFADPQVLSALRRDLPSLHILRIRRGDSTEVLVITEQRLSVRLEDFLNLAPDPAPRPPSSGQTAGWRWSAASRLPGRPSIWTSCAPSPP